MMRQIMSDSLNRREFLGASAAGAGAVLLGTQLGSRPVIANEIGEWPPRLPAVKIYKVYIGRTGRPYGMLSVAGNLRSSTCLHLSVSQAQVFVEKTDVLVCGQSIIHNYFNFFEGGLLCVRN